MADGIDVLMGSQTTPGPSNGLDVLMGGPQAPQPSSGATGSWAEPMSRIERFGTGLADPIHGGAQLLTHVLPNSVVDAGNSLNNWLADKTGLVPKLQGGVDKLVSDRETEYQARRAASGDSGFDGYRVLGNVASPANIAVASGLPVGATLAGRIGLGALGGATTSALNPVTQGGNYAAEKGKQIGAGALFGAAVPGVVDGVARVVSPKASMNPQLALLRNEGVQPTIGQTLGGAANSLEEKAQSIPLIGDLISYNRQKALDQFNRAAINRSTAPIGQQGQGIGTEGVKDAGDAISTAYNAAKAQLGAFRVDPQAQTQLNQLRALASSGLEGRELRAFNAYDKDYLGNFAFTADKFKELDSKLTTDIARYSGSQDAYQQKLGDALKQVQSILFDNAKRANPQAAAKLDAADQAYANLVRVEGAAVGAKGKDGVFTPGQLLTAVRGADKSVRDRSTARGTALMQDLAMAGQNVLGNKVPDSGTAGRLGFAGLGAALYANPVLTGGVLAGGLVGYTPAMQALLRGAVAARPQVAQPVANALRQASPAFAPLGAQVGLGLLN